MEWTLLWPEPRAEEQGWSMVDCSVLCESHLVDVYKCAIGAHRIYFVFDGDKNRTCSVLDKSAPPPKWIGMHSSAYSIPSRQEIAMLRHSAMNMNACDIHQSSAALPKWVNITYASVNASRKVSPAELLSARHATACRRILVKRVHERRWWREWASIQFFELALISLVRNLHVLQRLIVGEREQ